MLEILLQQQEIGPAKAVVAVAAQGQRSIQVSAPERRLKVKGHSAGSRGHRFGEQQSNANRAIQVPRARNWRTVGGGWTALIGASALRAFGRGLRVSVEKKCVVQINRPSHKGILRAGWRKKLLKVRQIIQLKIICDDRLDAHTFAELDESRLIRQSGCGRIGVTSFNRGDGLAVLAADVNEAAVHFAQERKIEFSDGGPLENRLDDVAADNGFPHSEYRRASQRAVVAQAKEIYLIE